MKKIFLVLLLLWMPGLFLVGAQAYEVLINELMADPNPAPFGLPPVEYIELANCTDTPIDLSGWTIRMGTSEKTLPPGTQIAARDFLLLYKQGAELEGFGEGVAFSSFSLTNTGAVLILRNTAGGVVHELEYKDNWYHDDLKAEGGWSLELIDMENPCGGAGNWSASQDASGGTPGRQNSVAGSNPDLRSPDVLQAYVSTYAPMDLQIVFSEPMDSVGALQAAAYQIDPPIEIVQVVRLAADRYLLSLAAALTPQIVYSLEMGPGLTDCVGTPLEAGQQLAFGLPETPNAGGLLLNEVLFNPSQDGCDFVELYNVSAQVIDLGLLALANYEPYSLLPVNTCPIAPQGQLLMPGAFVVLATDPESIRIRYDCLAKAPFVQMDDFPSMPDDAGTIMLLTQAGQLPLDYLSYSDEMHHGILVNTEGVSLERIRLDGAPNQAAHWHSASSSCGYATPGRKNSQYAPYQERAEEVVVSPEIFCPDNDGVDDLLLIQGNWSQPGQMVSITLFDQHGREFRRLVRNQMAGLSQRWSWDGTDAKNRPAAPGIYILYIEAVATDGTVKHYKRAAVLAGK